MSIRARRAIARGSFERPENRGDLVVLSEIQRFPRGVEARSAPVARLRAQQRSNDEKQAAGDDAAFFMALR